MWDDSYQIRAIVSRWIADDNVNAILTIGGTGLTGRDRFCLLGSTGTCCTASDRLIEDQLDYRHRPCNSWKCCRGCSKLEGHG